MITDCYIVDSILRGQKSQNADSALAKFSYLSVGSAP